MSTSTVQMKKSSGSGDRPRPTSFFPEADLAWAMGVQPNQTPKCPGVETAHPNQAPRSAPVNASQCRSRPLEKKTPLIEPWMDGSD